MTWKVINVADTGTASKFGGNDMDKISNSFSGTDVDDFDINCDFTIRSGKLHLRNPANTFQYNIVAAALAATRTLNLPLLTGTDTFAVLDLAQTFSNKTLDATCIIDNTSLSSDVVLETRSNDLGDFDFSVKDNRLRIWNPADTFRYTITGGTISANRILNLPVITGTDTLAVLGIPQTFTQEQTIKEDVSDLFKVYRPSSTVGDAWGILFDGNNASAAQTTYARVRGAVVTNTAGAEDGNLRFSIAIAGSLAEVGRFVETTGNFACGGTNRRIQLDDTGLTSTRVFKFANNTANIPGVTLSSGAIVDINTTVAETDMLNHSVVSNGMGANGSVKFLVSGYILQNGVAAATYTFKVKFGGTTMWADQVGGSFAQSATKMPFRILGELSNNNSTAAQSLSGQVMIGDATAPTTGIGDAGDDEINVNTCFDSEGADTTKDTTTANTLQVTVTMSVSDAATHTVVKHKEVQLVTSS